MMYAIEKIVHGERVKASTCKALRLYFFTLHLLI